MVVLCVRARTWGGGFTLPWPVFFLDRTFYVDLSIFRWQVLIFSFFQLVVSHGQVLRDMHR